MIALLPEARIALGIIAGSLILSLLVAQFLKAGKGAPDAMLAPDVDVDPARHNPEAWLDVERRAKRTAEAQASIDAARAAEHGAEPR